jgi:hypothetical protein
VELIGLVEEIPGWALNSKAFDLEALLNTSEAAPQTGGI